jgi:hypothetical protein
MPRTDEAGLNMTPMIDIVFQLILFFLFNLRFKSLDWRIDSALPTGIGTRDDNVVHPVMPHLRVTLTRIDPDDALKTRTRVKVAGSEWELPDVRYATEESRDRVFRALRERLRSLHAAMDLPGEIDCPMPTGALVPHADVMGVLDAFLSAKIVNVDFQGTPAPLPRSRRN